MLAPTRRLLLAGCLMATPLAAGCGSGDDSSGARPFAPATTDVTLSDENFAEQVRDLCRAQVVPTPNDRDALISVVTSTSRQLARLRDTAPRAVFDDLHEELIDVQQDIVDAAAAVVDDPTDAHALQDLYDAYDRLDDTVADLAELLPDHDVPHPCSTSGQGAPSSPRRSQVSIPPRSIPSMTAAPTTAPTTTGAVPPATKPTTATAPAANAGAYTAIDIGAPAAPSALSDAARILTNLANVDPVAVYAEYGISAGMPYITNSVLVSFVANQNLTKTLGDEPSEVYETVEVTMAVAIDVDGEQTLTNIVAAVVPDTWELSTRTVTSDDGIGNFQASAVEPGSSHTIDIGLISHNGLTYIAFDRYTHPGAPAVTFPQPLLAEAARWQAAVDAGGLTGWTGWRTTYGISGFGIDLPGATGLTKFDLTFNVPASAADDWQIWTKNFCAAASLTVSAASTSDDLICNNADTGENLLVYGPANGAPASGWITGDTTN